MSYKNANIDHIARLLIKKFDNLKIKSDILKANELKALYAEIPLLPVSERSNFGKEINELKKQLVALVNSEIENSENLTPIDVTSPLDINSNGEKQPKVLQSIFGSKHPLMTEQQKVLNIFAKMGFPAIESRQLDDEYHMFDSLNFPVGHPARDDYDTFITVEKDAKGSPFVAPAHASIMQNRILNDFKSNLGKNLPISAVYSGRTFRREDVDARHEHTFYQVEILYVDKKINASNLIATFKSFLEMYYNQQLEVKTQPFYFPFTEPSFEMALSCPFCNKAGCNICSYSGWIELLGMGLINPNVLKMAGIDSDTYTGFAGGLGLDRLVMMKYDIEDVRLFESGKLDFLRQFK